MYKKIVGYLEELIEFRAENDVETDDLERFLANYEKKSRETLVERKVIKGDKSQKLPNNPTDAQSRRYWGSIVCTYADGHKTRSLVR